MLVSIKRLFSVFPAFAASKVSMTVFFLKKFYKANKVRLSTPGISPPHVVLPALALDCSNLTLHRSVNFSCLKIP